MVAWIIANWDSVFIIVTGIIGVASVIAKLTPTEVDDKWVAKILQFVDLLALTPKDGKTVQK